MSAKQTLKQRKALRSAAAKKGWETRQAAQRKAGEEARSFLATVFNRSMEPVAEYGAREMWAADIGCLYSRFERDGVLETFETFPLPLIWHAKTWEEAARMSAAAKSDVTIHLPKGAPLRLSVWQRIKGWFA